MTRQPLPGLLLLLLLLGLLLPVLLLLQHLPQRCYCCVMIGLNNKHKHTGTTCNSNPVFVIEWCAACQHYQTANSL